MNTDGLIEAVQEHVQQHGRMKVWVDLCGQFIELSHTDVMVMRDAEGDTPVLFLNLQDEGSEAIDAILRKRGGHE